MRWDVWTAGEYSGLNVYRLCGTLVLPSSSKRQISQSPSRTSSSVECSSEWRWHGSNAFSCRPFRTVLLYQCGSTSSIQAKAIRWRQRSRDTLGTSCPQSYICRSCQHISERVEWSSEIIVSKPRVDCVRIGGKCCVLVSCMLRSWLDRWKNKTVLL
jgi:hypothetical protein